jgi:hypothetical protein
MKDFARQVLPMSIIKKLRPAYRSYRRLRDQLLRTADEIGIVGPDTIYPDNYYKKRQQDPWRSESNHIGTVLLEKFDPDSVIDFGCAIGAYLEPFHEQGIDIQGVDGSSAALDHAVVPQDVLTKHDLREPFSPDQAYELAICIEVAEHLPKSSADTLIEMLCNSAEIIVFTAAPPGQHGEHHVNLQPAEYWIEKFERHGKTLRRDHVETLRERLTVTEMNWVEENLFVFAEK